MISAPPDNLLLDQSKSTRQPIVDFFRRFADQCHHGKEEEILFPALEKAGIRRQGGPIGALLSEHECSRMLLAALSEAASQMDRESQRSRFMALAAEYAALLNAHIAKEETVLFDIAAKTLSTTQDTTIARAFEKWETDSIWPGEHEELQAQLRGLVHELLDSGRV